MQYEEVLRCGREPFLGVRTIVQERVGHVMIMRRSAVIIGKRVAEVRGLSNRTAGSGPGCLLQNEDLCPGTGLIKGTSPDRRSARGER